MNTSTPQSKVFMWALKSFPSECHIEKDIKLNLVYIGTVKFIDTPVQSAQYILFALNFV